MEPDEELNGVDDEAQIDETEGTTEGEDDGEVSDGAHESAEGGGEDGSSLADETQIAQAVAEASQVGNRSRAQERIRRQQEELREARDARIRAETQLAELQRQAQGQQAALEQQRSQQFLESLDPADRQAYMLQQQLESVRREMQQQQFTQADLLDKTQFQTQAMANPMVAKYAARVEQTLASMRAKGQTAPRESILKFLVGEEVLNKAPKAMQVASRAASKSTQKPLRSRGNAASPGNDEDADLEERLSKLTF